MRHLSFVVSLSLVACVTESEPVDVDDAIDEVDADKSDSAGAYRHYVLWAEPGDNGMRHLARAGGGSLRCPDDVVRDICELGEYDVVPTNGVEPGVIHDELADHAIIARGRLVRVTGGGVYLRASALTRGITAVMPTPTCYRLRSAGPFFDLELLDHAKVEHTPVLYFDEVDPTPDFWGQPTPAVQVKIDAALVLAATRPVYACGGMDRRDTGDLFWANQLFAPNR